MRLEWVTLVFLAVTVALVGLTVGSSQAMRAALFEDLLSFIPPIAFLVAVRVIRIAPSERFPCGLHRTVGIGHLVSATSSALKPVLIPARSTPGALAMLEQPRRRRVVAPAPAHRLPGCRSPRAIRTILGC